MFGFVILQLIDREQERTRWRLIYVYCIHQSVQLYLAGYRAISLIVGPFSLFFPLSKMIQMFDYSTFSLHKIQQY